jgi:hypothetical protein
MATNLGWIGGWISARSRPRLYRERGDIVTSLGVRVWPVDGCSLEIFAILMHAISASVSAPYLLTRSTVICVSAGRAV